MSIKGLRAAVEAVMEHGVTVDTLPALLEAAGEWARSGYEGAGGLPEGFRWSRHSGEDMALRDAGGELWALASREWARVWHNGEAAEGEGRSEFQSLPAAKAWCEATLFGSRP